MKRIILASLVYLSFSGLTHANNGVYASLKSGLSDTKLKNNVVNYIDSDQYFETQQQDDQTKSIYPNISAAVGYDFSTISPINARVELEYSYKDKTTFNANTNTESIDGDIRYPNEELFLNVLKSQSLMLNGYYDFKNTSKFTPYLSAGLGMTYIKNESTDVQYPDYSFSKSDNHFTWSAGVGVAYNITSNVALDLGYRYVDAGKFKFTTTVNDSDQTVRYKLKSNDYSLGIRYTF